MLGLSLELRAEHGERGFPVPGGGMFELGSESLAGGVLVRGGVHGELVAQLDERRLVSALSLGLERLNLDVGGGLQGGSKLRDGGGDGLSLLGLKLGLEGRLLPLERGFLLLLGEIERRGLGPLAAALEHLELRLEGGALLLRRLREQLSLLLGERPRRLGGFLVANLLLELLDSLGLVLDESLSLRV